MANIAAVEHQVNELQQALLEFVRNSDLRDQRTTRALDRLTAQNDRTALGLDRLSEEMREFKGEMAEFKNEMSAFKDETRQANAELRTSLDRQNAELNASLDRQNTELATALNQQNAKLSDTIGRLAEDVIGPSIPTLFKRFFPGTEPLSTIRVQKEHNLTGQRREFDTPAWNDRVFLFTETKSRLRPQDLDALSATIAEVRDYFPEAQGKKVCAALASLYIDPSLVTAGERRGFLMIALGNDLAEVMNSEGFRPAEF